MNTTAEPVAIAAGALSHLWANTSGLTRAELGHHHANKGRIRLAWPELAEALDELVEALQ